MSHGAAFVFINHQQAIGFGHVGWGFALDQETYMFGSTDHLLRTPMWHLPALLRYSKVKAGDDVDFWYGEGSYESMLQAMSGGPHIWYHYAKRLPVVSPDPASAREHALSLRDNGWCILDNNCVHQTARLLKIYGVADSVLNSGGIWPVEKSLRVPVKWFGALQAEPIDLSPVRKAKSTRSVDVACNVSGRGNG